MVEGATPQSDPTSEELHRGLSHLRGDIQDLRTQVASLHHRIDETNSRIDETNRSLSGRIDETNRRIDETNRSLAEVTRAMQANFKWTIATLIAITGILIAVITL